MRKIIVRTFLSLDGVMQAPGGPDEDPAGGFTLGGWTVPYFDEFLGEVMTEQMGRPFDLLLGRKTFEIFAAYWPNEESPINHATRYVPSTTITRHAWRHSVFINENVLQEIRKLKQQDGPDIQVHGSANLIRTLLAHDLVDEFWLKIFPVVLGKGTRLFGEGAIPGAYELVESKVSPAGVIVATLRRAGEFVTGSF